MNIWSNIWVALQSLTTNKLRSALTVLGITIGVLSVILCTAVGNGVRQQILGQVQALGSNSIIVFPGQQKRGGVAIGTKPSMKPKDAAAIRKECSSIVAVSATLQRPAQIKFGNKNSTTNIICTEPDYLVIQNFRVESGRFLTERDVSSMRKVCVIGKTTAQDLFGNDVPLGKMIRIQGVAFRIIGIMALKGSAMFGNPDDQVYIPVTAGMKLVFGVDYVTQLNAQVGEVTKNDQAKQELEKTLRKMHRLKDGDEDDFTILSQAELLRSVNVIGTALTLLLAGIASISLVVGGIGIMNIMIVSVTERTREIGIRKAVGARNRDILFQFLIESMTVTLLGGTIGILAGLGISNLIASLLGWSSIVSPFWIVASFASSTAIGVFFGIYPAYQASQLDPIEALRYQ
ncbi:MAG TPA: ABC transporter permease [Abditibacteriaceae bacterium]|jgi:ABC-type antimicrobial peptide transport system permease subunit